MPLNYSKWDALELSDDSDIEGHPNVDHKSLVRWKQRDIHERRMQRNFKIAQLNADIDCNTVLLGRLEKIEADVREKGASYFSQLVEKLRTNPSEERPPQSGANDPTYDGMILMLLNQVGEKAKEVGKGDGDAVLGEKLAEMLKEHVGGLKAEIEKKGKEVEEETKEKEKKITSEDIHEGWDSKYTPPKPAPEPLVKPKEKKAKKETKTEYETINAPTISSSASIPSGVPAPSSTSPVSEPTATSPGESSDEEVPELTPILRDFSKIEILKSDPASVFQKSFEFIQAHPEVYVEGAVDALLMEGLSSQMRAAKGSGSKAKKDAKYAFQCVHQGLLIQYCEKLGKDGVRMFFRKMITGDRVAIGVFEDDVRKTYKHLVERGKYHAENAEKGKEQIQLVAANEGEGGSITFNIPDGPPPEDLRLSEEASDMNVEDVRKALQLRWDLFSSFPDNMQNALKSEKLEEVNKVLGNMDVSEAEDIVQKLQMGGMLLFSEPGVRDVTGNAE